MPKNSQVILKYKATEICQYYKKSLKYDSSKVFLELIKAPCHEDVWGSGSIAPRITLCMSNIHLTTTMFTKTLTVRLVVTGFLEMARFY